jgi:polyphosphate kinase
MFGNGGAEEVHIGSADWMSRNLDWRVEAIAPIESAPLKRELGFILRTCWADRAQSWELHADGSYHRLRPRRGKGCQQVFHERYLKLASTR